MGLPAISHSRRNGAVLFCVVAASVGACRRKRMPLVPEEFKDGKYQLRFVPEGASEREPLLVSRRYAEDDKEWWRGDLVHVGLGNNLPVREGFSADVRVSPREAFTVTDEAVGLRDSEGFRFRIKEARWKRIKADCYEVRFHFDTDESISRIRYNDPTYHLTLKLTYEYKGKKEVIDIPRINPIVKRPPPRL